MMGRRWESATLVVALVLLFSGPATSQVSPSGNWPLPRMIDGQPDLQGIWANNSATPMERPEQFGDKARLTDEELAELASRIDIFRDAEQAGDLLGDRLIQQALGNSEFQDFDVITGNYNAFWLVERHLDHRTSLITEPPNGRRPPQIEAAVARGLEQAAYESAHPSDGPEDRSLGDRCLHFSVPNMGSGYNSYFQIFQTSDQLTILQEMGHLVRTVSLDGRPHLDEKIDQWAGNARGYWEGDTLVIETRNYDPRSRFGGATENLVLTERFSRIAPDVLRQEITLTDFDTWARPWTVELLLERTEDPIFEYACHEGNYAMPGILGGARAEERNRQSQQ